MSEINNDVSLCNIALSRCGVSMFIESMTEATQAAQVCNLALSFAKDKVLQASNWSFARKFATLQNLGSPPTNWAYRYAYPVRCVKVRQIVTPGNRNPSNSERIPFEIGVDETIAARVIYCDQELAEAEYTARIMEVALFPPIVASALAWALATEIVVPLTADAGRMKLAKAMYDLTIAEAISSVSGEFQGEAPEESDFILARG